MKALVFTERTPAKVVMAHRRVYRYRPDQLSNVFQVIRRNGVDRCTVVLLPGGGWVSSCPAQQHGARCWHGKLVAERKGRKRGVGPTNKS